MKKLYTNLFILVLALLCTSCATIFNAKTTNVTIVAKEPVKIVLEGDTLSQFKTITSASVNRSREPLVITAYNDSMTKTVHVKSKYSGNYYLNYGPSFPIGFIIDGWTPKKFTYPATIFIDIDKQDSGYLTYVPPNLSMWKYQNVLKITPLKVVALMNPSIEVSYERVTGQSFSTQVMASYLLPYGDFIIGREANPNTKGFRLAIEEKYYFKSEAPIGPYISFEFDYLKSQYHVDWTFHEMGDEDKIDFDEQPTYYDRFGINKRNYSFSIKYGYQLIKKNQFLFDIYAGLGFRYKDVEHFDRLNPDDIMESPRHPNVHYYSNKEGKYWAASVPMNIRIGWMF